MTDPPAFAGSGASVLVIDTSALVLTVVVAVAVLLPGVGSGVDDVTVAVFVSVVPVATFGSTPTMIVRGAEALAASVPIGHVTVPDAAVHPAAAERRRCSRAAGP